LRPPAKKISALDHAMRFLAARPHSEMELRKKLASRDHAPEDIDQALIRLKELRYIDDDELCARHAESRLARTNLGPGKLRMELDRKGFAKNLVEKTVAALYSDRQAEVETAIKAAIKKLKTLKPGLDKQAVRGKVYAHLIRKGFDMETARKVALDSLDSLMAQD